jgi:cell division protein FtsI/penicillin-binding protein 2
LLAMMEAGAVSAKTRFRCIRTLRLAGREMDCTHPKTGTPISPVDALAYSCNSFFAQAALRMNATDLAASLERFGLSAETGGSVRLAGTRELLQLQAIGEHGVEVSPLTLAHAYRRHVPDNETVMAGLRAAVEYGTAQLARPDRVPVAGKTGTPMSRGRGWAHGWFCGFAPSAAPEIVVTVFVENGSGGADAAPIARTIFEAWREAR